MPAESGLPVSDQQTLARLFTDPPGASGSATRSKSGVKCFPQIDPDPPSTLLHPQTPGRALQGLLAALRSTLQGSPRRLLRRVRLMGGRDLTTGGGLVRLQQRCGGRAALNLSRALPDPGGLRTIKIITVQKTSEALDEDAQRVLILIGF